MGLENRGRTNGVGIELRGNSKPLEIKNKGMQISQKKGMRKGDMFGIEERFSLGHSLRLEYVEILGIFI
jgi:hypothetical protein